MEKGTSYFYTIREQVQEYSGEKDAGGLNLSIWRSHRVGGLFERNWQRTPSKILTLVTRKTKAKEWKKNEHPKILNSGQSGRLSHQR